MSKRKFSNPLAKLQHLSLTSQICSELENHVDISDKTLAEFIIHLAEEAVDVNNFISKLTENGADFPLPFCRRMYSIVESMMPKKQNGAAFDNGQQSGNNVSGESKKFPGLAIPNQPKINLEVNTTDRVDSTKANRRSSENRNGVGNTDRNRDKDSDYRKRRSRSRSRERDRNRRRRSRSRDRSSSRWQSKSRTSDREAAKFGYAPVQKRPSDWTPSNSNSVLSRNTRPSSPQLYHIYDGEVTNMLDFGCFVSLSGFKPKREGMVHLSRLKKGGKVLHPSDVVSRNSRVKVKVLGKVGTKLCLSMRDVDQTTGADLQPEINKVAERINDRAVKPEKISSIHTSNGRQRSRARALISDQERFEVGQLIKSGVLRIEDYPDFDEDVGLTFEKTERTTEVDLADVEPAFLRGQTRISGLVIEPLKIVKNPDGSLQRAATTQAALSKERRELRDVQDRELFNNIPKDLNRPWVDPMPDQGERHLASELRGIGRESYKLPDWKKKSFGGVVAMGNQTKAKLSMKDQREGLPIFGLRGEFLQAVKDNQILVVVGETGSGKTTQMTQYLAEAGYTSLGCIGCTQPRRVAATSVSKRVAEEFGCRLGQEVGYCIRFEDCTSQDTVIKYMTDGMLMREYLMGETLKRYSVLILDEAHERTIHTDVLFALLKSLCSRRKDFKLIITSATLDAEKFSKYYNECPIFSIPGRTFPVTILYSKTPESDYVDSALITVMQIHLSEPEGDILVFFTGQEEIDGACEVLYNRMEQLGPLVPELMILPVYGALPSEMQSKIFDPAPPGTRKCVVATNIAEASLTIDGIYYVIDPGFCKQKVYNSKIGMDSLVVTPISQASAKQRAGRAGRTGPGKCFRLYTEAAFQSEMLETSVPEIQRTNLGNVVLQLKAMGINDLLNFDFMDPPPPQTMVRALEELFALGALDDDGLMTRLGRKMSEFPLEPSLSKILIKSESLGCSDEILTIVAMLSVDNVFYRPKEKQAQADQKKARFYQPEGDHLTLLAVYEAWRASKFSTPWCFDNFIQARSMRKAQDIRKQLLGIMDRYKMEVVSAGRKYDLICKAIVSGFFSHAAKKDPTEGYKTMVEGTPVFIHPSSALFQKNPEWVIYHELVLTSKEYMRSCMGIDPKWLLELAPNFYQPPKKSRVGRRKLREKIQPLYDRFNPLDEWRLSYKGQRHK